MRRIRPVGVMNPEHAMNHPLSGCRPLARGEFLHLRGTPVRLRAERGSLWITQDGDPDDVLLDAGQAHDFTALAPLVIGALSDGALVRVTALQPPRPAWPGWRAWLGAVAGGVRS